MCRLYKLILLILLVCLIAAPVAMVFGSTVALIVSVIGVLYVFEHSSENKR